MARRPHHLTPWKTEFTVEGKNFDWYGQHELVLDGKKVAHFFPTWHILDQDEHKLGRLVVHGEGKKFVDLVVLTGLIMIDQSEEGRAAVCSNGRVARLISRSSWRGRVLEKKWPRRRLGWTKSVAAYRPQWKPLNYARQSSL
jgi:hypothetical protein